MAPHWTTAPLAFHGVALAWQAPYNASYLRPVDFYAMNTKRHELLERHAQLQHELRDLHLGKTIRGNVDLAAREQQLRDELQSIVMKMAEQQIGPTTTHDARDNATRMTELALTFPSLGRDVPGIHPWDQGKLDEWAQSGIAGHGARCAAEFLLYVWNPGHDTPWAGRFRLEEALKTWDVFHRHAFLWWIQDPWWP